jgi:UDP-glucose 4-epimerase
MSGAVSGSKILITGGTGSFGSTMVRHLLATDVEAVHVLSRDEAKQDQLRKDIGDPRLKLFLGDVRDYESLVEATVGVDFVFHAAALKQVPSCEFFPEQAVRTNVDGSRNVIRAAASAGVQSVVCLSTDKAVYPINAMGMSKALMEKTAQAWARNHPTGSMTVSITRYGNVMYSRGSVIPLFISQLRQGVPLTITDPTMTRFLMSLEESVSLVLHAFTNAEPGDLYVRKAPACTIDVLARAVAKVLGQDSEIKILGTRHGEKKHETLLSREEMVRAQDQGDYYRVPLDARSLEYELYFDAGDQRESDVVDYTSANTTQLGLEETCDLISRLPEVRAAQREFAS